MGRSRESFSKKTIREKKAKKRKDREQKRLARKENQTNKSEDDMFAYVDEFGRITSIPPDPSKKEEIEVTDIITSTPKQEPDAHKNDIREGILTNFNESKGFGFIQDSMTQERFFAHVSVFKDVIEEGNKVTYKLVKGDRGPVANNVELVK